MDRFRPQFRMGNLTFRTPPQTFARLCSVRSLTTRFALHRFKALVFFPSWTNLLVRRGKCVLGRSVSRMHPLAMLVVARISPISVRTLLALSSILSSIRLWLWLWCRLAC